MTNPILVSSNLNNNNILKGGADELEKFVMENCLMLFQTQAANAAVAAAHAANAMPGRAFTCKTCGKKFHSFQALGGHRASHKKLKPAVSNESLLPAKPKSHSCTICGAEFPTGQALGGHMRRHRPVVVADVSGGNKSTVTTTTTATTEVSVGDNQVKKRKIEEVSEEVRPVLNNKRVCLDFNFSFAPWVMDIEEGEIIEKHDEDEDFLKLELRQPIRN